MDAQALDTADMAMVGMAMEAGVARTMEDMEDMGVGHVPRSTMEALSMLRPPLEDTHVDLMVDMVPT